MAADCRMSIVHSQCCFTAVQGRFDTFLGHGVDGMSCGSDFTPLVGTGAARLPAGAQRGMGFFGLTDSIWRPERHVGVQ